MIEVQGVTNKKNSQKSKLNSELMSQLKMHSDWLLKETLNRHYERFKIQFQAH